MVCEIYLNFKKRGTSLAVQWLRLQAPNTGGMGSIPAPFNPWSGN